jgi:hypothetical protein
MLVMPNPTVPDAVWEVGDRSEMKEEAVGLYVRMYRMWEADKGDLLLLGRLKLMMSFT